MPLMNWSDQLTLHVAKIDAEHKELIDILNELYDAMMSGKAKDDLQSALMKLVQHTRAHFQSEEQLMRKYAYPELLPHLNEHRKLTDQVMKLQKDLDAGRTMDAKDILNFLKTWLTEHIQGTDRNLAVYLNEQGVN
jgi:hemerythrin